MRGQSLSGRMYRARLSEQYYRSWTEMAENNLLITQTMAWQILGGIMRHTRERRWRLSLPKKFRRYIFVRNSSYPRIMKHRNMSQSWKAYMWRLPTVWPNFPNTISKLHFARDRRMEMQDYLSRPIGVEVIVLQVSLEQVWMQSRSTSWPGQLIQERQESRWRKK